MAFKVALGLLAVGLLTFACGDFFDSDEDETETSQTAAADQSAGCEWIVAESYPEQVTGDCQYALGTETSFTIALTDLPPNETTITVTIDDVSVESAAFSYDASANTLTLRLAQEYSGLNQIQIRYTASTENRN